nr:LysR family transcriptional regulator [Candidatus Pantoea persica]
MVMALALVRYRQQAAAVNVELVTEHFLPLCRSILDDQLDFALVFGQQVDADLLAEPLFHFSMVALLPPHLARQEPVSLAWLCANNLLLMQAEEPLGRVLHRAP